MLAQMRAAALVFILLTIVTGFIYPAIVTLVGQTVFPHQANGSLITQGDKVVGSELLGQGFAKPEYFWSRPSATTPGYNGGSSSGSNLGPTNPDYFQVIADRVAAIKAAHPDQTGPVPVDLVTTSASGLDPHISPAAAEYQVARVAKARGLAPNQVRKLVAEHTENRTLGILGEPRVNVLQLNLALAGVSHGL